jgi:hypothetical protein
MGIFGKKNKEVKPVELTYIDGVEGYSKGTVVTLSLNDEKQCLVMEALKGNYPLVNISFEKIVAANLVHERDVIESNKSTAGRAIVGGVLLGPLGAIVGGMSGIGTKKNTKLRDFLVINYKSQDTIKVLSFEIVNITLNLPKFINKLREKIQVKENTEIYL